MYGTPPQPVVMVVAVVHLACSEMVVHLEVRKYLEVVEATLDSWSEQLENLVLVSRMLVLALQVQVVGMLWKKQTQVAP